MTAQTELVLGRAPRIPSLVRLCPRPPPGGPARPSCHRRGKPPSAWSPSHLSTQTLRSPAPARAARRARARRDGRAPTERGLGRPSSGQNRSVRAERCRCAWCACCSAFVRQFEWWVMAVWLDAHQDPVAAIHTTPSCIRCSAPHPRPPSHGPPRGAQLAWRPVLCMRSGSPTSRARALIRALPHPRLCDVTGDGDPKLLVADQNRKLRLYKGINLVSEHALVTQAVCAAATCWRRDAGLRWPPQRSVHAR